MKHLIALTVTTAVLLVLLPPDPASARSFRVRQMPNGQSFSCNLCHIFPGGPFNAVGNSVNDNLDGFNADWSAVYDLDSDGDGFTDGEELGDPFGAWRSGDPNPPFISDPNGAFSTPGNPGQPPSAQAGSLSLNEDTSGSGTLRGTDPEGARLVFYLSEAPEHGQVSITNLVTGAYRYTPEADFHGEDSFTFFVWAGSSSTPATISITVEPVNDPPTVQVAGDRRGRATLPLTLTVTAEDIDSDVFEYSAEGLPEGADFDADAGVLTWTPAPGQVGQHAITFVAVDDDGARGEARVTLDIDPAPTPPEIVAIIVPQGGGEAQVLGFEAQVEDNDDDTHEYCWDFGDGSEEVCGEDLDEPQHSFPDDGRYEVRLRVRDDEGGEDSDTATVEIENVAPLLDAGDDLEGFERQPVAFQGAAVDVPGDLLSWCWDFGDGSSEVCGVELSDPEHVYNGEGVYEVIARVDDGEGGEAEDALTVAVFNAAPVVGLDAPPPSVEGATVELSAEVSDPGDDVLTYRWDFGDGSPLLVGVGLNSPSHTYVDDPPGGAFIVSLLVDDGEGGQGEASVRVVVSNLPPSVEAGANLSGAEGIAVRFGAVGTDPGADELTWRWDFGDGTEPLEGLGLSTPTHTFAQDGVYEVEVSVDDGDGGSDRDTLQVTISNTAPRVTIEAPLEVREGTPALYQARAEDPGEDSLEYCWDFGDGSDEVCGEDLSSLEHTYPSSGTHSLTLTLRDGEGASGTDTRLIEVSNLPPAIESIPVESVCDEGYRYQIAASDPGGDGFVFSLRHGPAGLEVSETGLVTWNPALYGGIHPVVVRVTDDEGAVTLHAWSIALVCEDRDGDQAPDACEARFGLDPDDPSDGAQDPDGDGFTSAEECVRGSHPLVSNGPSAPSIHQPVLGALVDEAPATLSVNNATDPDSDPLAYTFEVSTSPDLAPIVLDRRGVPGDEGAGRTAISMDEVLLEDQVYYWRARACDARSCGPWTELAHFLFSTRDDAPLAPDPISPLGSVGSAEPTLTARNAEDPEGGFLTYDFLVARADTPEDPLIELVGVPEGERRTSATLDSALDEDTLYVWRVRAVDEADQPSPWSEAQPFLINVDNRLPSVPTLLEPSAGAHIASLDGLALAVGESDDEDGDALIYSMRLSREASFSEAAILAQVEGLVPDEDGQIVWPFDGLSGLGFVEDRAWFWEARAHDGFGAGDPISAHFVFSASNDSPSRVTLQSPAEGEVVQLGAPSFEWLAAIDPEGDPLTYTLEIFADEMLISRLSSFDGLVETRLEDVALDDQRRYTWRVRAEDGAEGGEGPWSDPVTFVLSTSNAAPTAPIPIDPAGTVLEEGDRVEFVWEDAEDLEGAPLVYTLEVFDASGEVVFTDEVPENESGPTTDTRSSEVFAAGDYTWRVSANDGEQTGPWSNSAAFQIEGEALVDPPQVDPPDETCAHVPGAPSGVPWWLVLVVVCVVRRAGVSRGASPTKPRRAKPRREKPRQFMV